MAGDAVDLVSEHQLRQVCAELDRRLRAGHRARSEDFFAACPALSRREDWALELIYTEFVTREELGQRPVQEEYFSRFPQWRTVLQEQFQIHAALRRVPLADAPPKVLPTSCGSDSPGTFAGTLLPGFDLSRHDGSSRRCVGSYELLEEIARGAMGVVYKARHRTLQRLVALKMVLAGPHAGQAELARFRTEAEAIARLQHPNIVQIYEVGDFEGYPYLSLEYIEGGSLAGKLAGQPQPCRFAAQLVETLARAIDYAHQRGIIHRDLKPSNILLGGEAARRPGGAEKDSCPPSHPPASAPPHHPTIPAAQHRSTAPPLPLGTPKITDFGLAKLLDHQSGLTETGAVFGTPSYMAPEQAAGQSEAIGPAADVYALGAILYELLTGRPPFRAATLLSTLHQVVSAEPVPPERLQPAIPRDLATICRKCLAKEPHRRYADAAALTGDLQRYLAGEPILARPSGLWERGWKWTKRRPSVAALLVVLCAAAVTLLLGSWWYNGRLRAFANEAKLHRAQAQSAAEEASRQQTKAQVSAWEARQKGVEARNAAWEAHKQKAEALRQAGLVKSQNLLLQKQGDDTRRLLFTLQLARAEEIWQSNPGRALRLLDDQERCPPDLRDFAWRLFHHLCKQDRTIANGRAHEILALAFSPDGKTLATAGGRDGTVQLWDSTTCAQRATLHGHRGAVMCLSFAPDSRTLASAGDDGSIRLWATSKGKDLAVLRGHVGAIHALAFSPDGRTLASGGVDTTVKLWDVTTRKERMILRGHTGAICALRFSADGQLVLSASVDRTARLWDLITLDPNRERWRLNLDDSGSITCLAISPDAKRLALAGTRRAVVDIYDLDTLTKRGSCQGHVDKIRSLVFSSDGKLLATGSEDQTVRVWEAETGAERFTFQGHTGCIRCVSFAPDGQTLASAGDDHHVWLWALATRGAFLRQEQNLARSRSRLTDMAFAPNGKLLATGTNNGMVQLMDAETGLDLCTLHGHTGTVWCLAFAADGKTLATGGEDANVILWDVIARRKLATLTGHHQCVRSLAFTADGKTLATAGDDGIVKLWSVAQGQELGGFRGSEAALYSVGFSPDGKTLVTGSYDGRVTLWNVATRREQATLIEHRKAVLFTVFSPAGSTLVTGGLDNTVKLWDVATLSLRATLSWNSGYVFSAVFTPDSQTLAIGGGSRAGSQLPGQVKLWDVATGHCRATLQGQTGPLAFSPSGSTLATVSHYTRVKLWHTIGK